MSASPGGAPEPEERRATEGVSPPPVPECGIRFRRSLCITVAYFAVQIAIGTMVGVLVGICFGVARGAMTPEVMAEFQSVAVPPAAALSMVGSGFVAFAMTRRALPGPIRDGALRPIGWTAGKREDIVLAACLGLVLAAFCILVLGRLYPPAPGQKWGPITQSLASGGWQRLLWVVLALCIAPPVEEFLFRGVLWSGLVRSMNAGLAAAAVTLLFLIGHISEMRGYWPAWAMISLLGLGALFLRVRSASLAPPVALHVSYNACMAAVLLLGAR